MIALTHNAARLGTGVNPLFVALCALGLIVWGGGQTLACTLIPQYGPAVDRPIEVSDNGSFQYAEPDERKGSYKGRRVADIHHGLVAQRLVLESGCDRGEILLVVDCNDGLAAFVYGVGGDIEGYTSIDPLLAPKGALRLGKMDFFEILAVAEKHDYRVEIDALGGIRKMKKKNRFDPFWGCKKFYPESDGARKEL